MSNTSDGCRPNFPWNLRRCRDVRRTKRNSVCFPLQKMRRTGNWSAAQRNNAPTRGLERSQEQNHVLLLSAGQLVELSDARIGFRTAEGAGCGGNGNCLSVQDEGFANTGD